MGFLIVSADPMDPELGFPPFDVTDNPSDGFINVFHPVTWIKNGVLQELSYDRFYAAACLGTGHGIGSTGAFRMDGIGEPTTVEEMIATTKRGLMVTCFSQMSLEDSKSTLMRGYTRNGLWLIENGKISKSVKNMAITESILFALNNIEQIGAPQRVFHPPKEVNWGAEDLPAPVVVPPLKIRDFSFTALIDAI